MNAREGATTPGTSTADAPTGLLEKTIRKVPELLTLGDLHIPQYQRPYKWTARHVNQLLADLATHQDKSAYRLGTVVLHKDDDGKLNIVDGQQRTVTLLLLVHALLKCPPDPWEDASLRKELEALRGKMFKPQFKSDISKRNVWLNYQEIVRHVGRPEFGEAQVRFLLRRCELVCVTLGSVSEAFQFFDAQNARGRDLNPHDLLKAFHLREFSDDERGLQAQTVRVWESCSGDELAQLFADYLYRVRNWCRGKSARTFGKGQTALFKGVSLHRVKRYRFVQPLRMVDAVVDDYNSHIGRRMDGARLDYPFQLDAHMVNGRRFFEWVAHYQSRGFHLKPGKDGALAWTGSLGQEPLTERAQNILRVLESYPGRHRQGDRYVRCMFDCLLMYYIDRFGHEQLSAAIEKAFIWAYRVRLEMYAVQLATMDNHVLENNVFSALREAVEPGDFLHHSLPSVKKKVLAGDLEALVQIFKDMKYWEAGDA